MCSLTTGDIIWLSLIAVAGVIVAIGFIIRRKRKNKSAVETEDKAEGETR